MKKALAIFFCLQILSGNTFAMEVMKLPFLIQHYIEHETEEHPDLGFGTFLWEHYVEDDHEDEPKGHCDENLPFKHCNDCCSHVSAVITCLIPDNCIDINYPCTTKDVNFTGEINFHSFYHSCIWQPPKIG